MLRTVGSQSRLSRMRLGVRVRDSADGRALTARKSKWVPACAGMTVVAGNVPNILVGGDVPNALVSSLLPEMKDRHSRAGGNPFSSCSKRGCFASGVSMESEGAKPGIRSYHHNSTVIPAKAGIQCLESTGAEQAGPALRCLDREQA